MKVVWNVKIKTGIFQTQEYLLKIEEDRIILSPRTAVIETIRFCDLQIKLITLIKKNAGAYELEVDTHQGIYYGVLTKTADVSEIFKALSQTFGSKVSII